MKVVVSIDGSKYGDMCLAAAAFLCKDRDLKVHVINVVPHFSNLEFGLLPGDRDVTRDDFTHRAEQLLRAAVEFLEKQGVKNVKARIIKGPSPSDAIVEYVEDEKANLLIIGARGASEGTRFLLGAEAPKIVKYAPCCVYIVKESCMEFCAAPTPAEADD
jgi:nucleotide-binding universal stress UspA family protein